jgi:hypothetical protein
LTVTDGIADTDLDVPNATEGGASTEEGSRWGADASATRLRRGNRSTPEDSSAEETAKKGKRGSPRTRRAASVADVPTEKVALAAARVAMAPPDDRRVLDRIVNLKNPPSEPADGAVAVAFGVFGLSDETRQALTSLYALHAADPVTIGVNLGRTAHSQLAEMHRVAAVLRDVDWDAAPGDDRAIAIVARDLDELTDTAFARAGVLDRITS